MAGGIVRRGSTSSATTSVFSIDTPAEGATVFGIVEVRGFILDPRGVSRITLLLDGSPVHDADLNQPREDVRKRYARYYGEDFPYNPGFVTSFLAGNFPSGSHALAIRITFSNSDIAELGARSIIIDNTINQAPIGLLDNPRDPNIYGTTDYISSVFPVVGWALDDQGVRTTTALDGHIRADIEVMVDGMVVGQAIYPLPRPDVANAHPDVSNSLLSGFQMNLDTTRFTNGQHTVSVRVWDVIGMNRVIGSETMWVDNNYSTLGPFGKIDFPMPNGYLFSTSCRENPPISGIEYQQGHWINWISGWVIDQNDQQRFEGVKYVELLLDGVILKRTSIDCAYLAYFDQEMNCYGKDRPDILYQYPQFGADAKKAGFLFAIDGDWLVGDPAVTPGALGLHRGLHYLAIRVGTQDPVRPAVIIDQIPVVVTCNENGDVPSFGVLERPIVMQDMKGIELVKGWVIDLNNGVKQLNFYVDGILDGKLVAPVDKVNLLRMDVELAYPWLPYPFSRYNGFEYLLDTTKYVDGWHQLVIESIDSANYHNYWVQRGVVFNNPN
jgi:N-acetylmuramoyl-L-alanine amidase